MSCFIHYPYGSLSFISYLLIELLATISLFSYVCDNITYCSVLLEINQAISVDQYPLPKPEDLFATLANGSRFTKLDLSQAYLQLKLDDASMQYVTVNTHQGLYQYTRLPFGVASAPAIFQRLMDNVFLELFVILTIF